MLSAKKRAGALHLPLLSFLLTHPPVTHTELATNMQSAALIHRDLIGEFHQLEQLQAEYRFQNRIATDSQGDDAITRPSGIGSWL
jgi:hypothetical protein